MQIKAKIRGFLCTTAHPDGCQKNVYTQADRAQQYTQDTTLTNKPKNVLIIGGSAGYGLASRILCGAGYGANTLSISLEKGPRENRTASAGWYNNYYFAQWSKENGIPAHSLEGDAFSASTKAETADFIRTQMGHVDLVIYSLAAPRRTKQLPDNETLNFQSVIKPIGQQVEGHTIDTASGDLKAFQLDPATDKELEDTVAVMGGEDWYDWIQFLKDADVLSPQAQSIAFSYLGGELTNPIYGKATLGAAKEDLDKTCARINQELLTTHQAQAKIVVLKAIVTQSSAAIPSLPLYISVLYRVMKEEGIHEDCMDQIIRLFNTGLYPKANPSCLMDKPYRLRLDDRELEPGIQKKVKQTWQSVNADNLSEMTDVKGYQHDFLKLFGFGWPDIDYQSSRSPLPEQTAKGQ